MNPTRQLANQINAARDEGKLVYAWPQRGGGRHLVYCAKCIRGQLKVQLALGRWATVQAGDVEIVGLAEPSLADC